MLDNKIKLSDFLILLNQKFGQNEWLHLEPETILLEFGTGDELLLDKIYVLKCLASDVNGFISMPEFLLWMTAVANNETADFEVMNIPTCLELAWAIEQAKKIALLSGQIFKPKSDLIDVIAYLLVLEGFSHPVAPFDFVPSDRLTAGQTSEDSSMKEQAIKAYVKHMEAENA